MRYMQCVSNYDNTITLICGQWHLSSPTVKWFDWKFDNSVLEYDNSCTDWEFYEIDNDIRLSCYPDYIIFKNETLLQQIKN